MTIDRNAARSDLARPARRAASFDPDTLEARPALARRFLTAAVAPGTACTPGVELTMEGEIRLKRWTPFTATQVLRAGEGFVWEARAGRGPVVVTGADTLWGGRGGLDFRLWGIVPVARASGPDVVRSASGRLAAEVAAWSPQALVDAEWTSVDEGHVSVAVPVPDGTIDVTLAVSAEGRATEVSLRRWGDPDGEPFGEHAFGAASEAFATFEGITIPSAGRVGWHWGTDRQAEGEFFRYRITDARPLPAA